MTVSEGDQTVLIRLFGPHWDPAYASRQPRFERAVHIDQKNADPDAAVDALLTKVTASGPGFVPAGWSWRSLNGRGELIVWSLVSAVKEAA